MVKSCLKLLPTLWVVSAASTCGITDEAALVQRVMTVEQKHVEPGSSDAQLAEASSIFLSHLHEVVPPVWDDIQKLANDTGVARADVDTKSITLVDKLVALHKAMAYLDHAKSYLKLSNRIEHSLSLDSTPASLEKLGAVNGTLWQSITGAMDVELEKSLDLQSTDVLGEGCPLKAVMSQAKLYAVRRLGHDISAEADTLHQKLAAATAAHRVTGDSDSKELSLQMVSASHLSHSHLQMLVREASRQEKFAVREYLAALGAEPGSAQANSTFDTAGGYLHKLISVQTSKRLHIQAQALSANWTAFRTEYLAAAEVLAAGLDKDHPASHGEALTAFMTRSAMLAERLHGFLSTLEAAAQKHRRKAMAAFDAEPEFWAAEKLARVRSAEYELQSSRRLQQKWVQLEQRLNQLSSDIREHAEKFGR
eukprot:gnl/TRDRNA2_/TRDRNA2_33020_c0_seq1.p1 gnl/TRDRNA2_/TRDRNA2_33020_c0~~gnl/TRDRNA2_/TRDRNA2_33020_c0_seq1.p1  ORF type:complete len:423 (+),score=86.71 gnl/TRDRNA2_/TRDRNA2_33020_c0_seq1:65-1333(+)